MYNMHTLENKSSLAEVSDAGGILERYLEDNGTVFVLLGNLIMAEGPVLVMPIDGQDSDSVNEQQDHFNSYCEVLSFVK